jgi:hypothetical protein
VDVAKLPIPIPMLRSFLTLYIQLPSVVQLFQPPAYGVGRNRRSPTSSAAIVRVDVLVQRNRFIGSPAGLSSTMRVLA